jgi:hypothetical protein
LCVCKGREGGVEGEVGGARFHSLLPSPPPPLTSCWHRLPLCACLGSLQFSQTIKQTQAELLQQREAAEKLAQDLEAERKLLEATQQEMSKEAQLLAAKEREAAELEQQLEAVRLELEREKSGARKVCSCVCVRERESVCVLCVRS